MSKGVTTGAEYIWGKNESKDGSSATDARLQWSTRVTFCRVASHATSSTPAPARLTSGSERAAPNRIT
jgi:hypothetical protein